MKIAAFRKKLEKEKASIDARLKSGAKEQLDATREGLRRLFSTRNNVQAIRDEMETVDKMCRDPQNVVATFDQISRVRPKLLSVARPSTDSTARFLWCTGTSSKRRRW